MHRVVVLACLWAAASASVSFSNVFGSNMVLQRDGPAMVWGWATASTTVKVGFKGLELPATADSTGFWRLALPAQKAGGPFTITATGSDSSTASLSNVMFGDVFLCGGQSNMEMTVASILNATAEVAHADDYPNIRVFTVGQGNASYTPFQQLGSIEQTWSVASAESIGMGNWTAFSAVCWLTGRNVYDALKGEVPIGLISNNWGGTEIQLWSSPDALAKCTQPPAPPPARSDMRFEDGELWKLGASLNSVLWNAMIYPYTLGPMGLKGFLWYQGEANADANQTTYYACQFPATITDWRTKFNSANLFYGFVLLSAYVQDASFDPRPIPYLRQSQLAALALPNVGVASATDAGEPPAENPPWGTVHSQHKEIVGTRMANVVLAMVYHQSTPFLSPRYQHARVIGISNSVARVDVAFFHDTVQGGLTMRNASCPASQGVPAWECDGFDVQTSDGVWIPATATLSADTRGVTLMASGIPSGAHVVATRAMFSPWPVVTLYGNNGLPALPWNEPVL